MCLFQGPQNDVLDVMSDVITHRQWRETQLEGVLDADAVDVALFAKFKAFFFSAKTSLRITLLSFFALIKFLFFPCFFLKYCTEILYHPEHQQISN